MLRIDALRAVRDDIAECAVVTIMGAVAAELYSLGHRANFFYLDHAMGLASSIGLGIALAQPDRRGGVVDGGGSGLLKLGGRNPPATDPPPHPTAHLVYNQALL